MLDQAIRNGFCKQFKIQTKKGTSFCFGVLDILLFLAGNKVHDTAADIVNMRYLTKSHVSTAVHALEMAGYLKRQPKQEDKRVIHLSLTQKADEIVKAGQEAQESFLQITMQGISEEELACMKKCFTSINRNIQCYLKTEVR